MGSSFLRCYLGALSLLWLSSQGFAAGELTSYDAINPCYHEVMGPAEHPHQVWLDCIAAFETFLTEFPSGVKAVYAAMSVGTLTAALCRSHHVLEDCERAAERLELVQHKYPENPFADQALMRAAELAHTPLGQNERSKLSLRTLLERYPASHYTGKATIMLEALTRQATNRMLSNESMTTKPEIQKITPVLEVRCWSLEKGHRLVLRTGAELDPEREPSQRVISLSNVSLDEEVLGQLRTCLGSIGGMAEPEYRQGQLKLKLPPDTTVEIAHLQQSALVVLDIVPVLRPELGRRSIPGLEPVHASPKQHDQAILDAIRGGLRTTSGTPEKRHITKVVIDPGHGGEDEGARGPTGLREKDVVLHLGLRVAELIQRELHLKAILTRRRDIFIDLVDRANLANLEQADLFISIHANANKSSDISGIQTFYLNNTTEVGSLKLAERENLVPSARTAAASIPSDSLLDFIKLDLTKNRDTEESRKLAGYIQREMVSALGNHFTEVRDLGVNYALFNVLWGTKMPSVLLEVSFLTNPMEERRLRDDFYLDKLAEGITRGIFTYILSVEGNIRAGS